MNLEWIVQKGVYEDAEKMERFLFNTMYNQMRRAPEGIYLFDIFNFIFLFLFFFTYFVLFIVLYRILFYVILLIYFFFHFYLLEHPMLYTEKPWNPPETRAKTAELLFETRK